MKQLITLILPIMIAATPLLSFSNSGNLDFKTIKVETSVKNPKDYKHSTSTLLISCVDYRLRDETQKLMEQIGLKDDYDEVTLPGASLAVVGEKHPHWAKTADEIIDLLKPLHHFKQVIILDHFDCGAYKVTYGKSETVEKELATHKSVLLQATRKIQKSFPDLKVHSLIIGIDGRVENLTNDLIDKK